MLRKSMLALSTGLCCLIAGEAYYKQEAGNC